ncbi:hypothetical protein [uncultured Eubacterium sp.]|uniref:hypothetical protein n=1 Tax=uncultured Eubacterium sp. TaxID=165185 RepID=UPI0026179F98|nr:hypothetical protein [uncultured Eubacterium sp.]
MRLIDADEIDFNEVFVGASKFAEDTRQAGKMLIDAQPTAYDVDKVLEQLEYSRVPNTGIAGYHKVIEIVKGGGIDGNTNT